MGIFSGKQESIEKIKEEAARLTRSRLEEDLRKLKGNRPQQPTESTGEVSEESDVEDSDGRRGGKK